MSDDRSEKAPEPAPQPGSPAGGPVDSSAAAKPTKSAKAKRPHRWRRRFAWFSLIVLVLAGVVRMLVPFLFPVVLKSVCARYGLDVGYERSEFNFLSGDVGLWYLELRPHGSNQSILRTGYVRGDISPLRLFEGKLDVWRVEADGVDVNLTRDASGHIALLDQLLAAAPARASAPPPPAAAAAGATTPQAIDLAPPLTMDAMRLTNLNVTIRDDSVKPAFVTHVAVNLRVSDVGSMARPTTFELDVWSDSMLDSLRIEGTGHSTPGQLTAEGQLSLGGLRLGPAAAYLNMLGIQPVAQDWAARGAVKLVLSTTQPSGSISADADLTGLSLDSDGVECAAADHVAIHAPQITPSSAHVAKIEISGVRATAGRSADGNLTVAGLQLGGVPTSATSSPGPAAAANAPPAAASKGEPVGATGGGASSPGTPFSLIVDEFSVSAMQLKFDDAGIVPAANLGLNVDSLSVRNIVLDPRQPNAIWKLDARLSSPGIARGMEVTGTAVPGAAEKTANFAVTANGIHADAVKPYLDRLGIRSQLKDATFSAQISAQLQNTPTGIAVAAGLQQIKLTDGADLLDMPAVSIDGLETNSVTGRIKLAKITITGPVTGAQVDAAGHLHILGMEIGGPSTAAPPVAAASTPDVAIASAPPAPSAVNSAPTTAATAVAVAPVVLPSVEIGLLQWSGIKVEFVDGTATPPVTTSLADAGVEIHDLVLDVNAGAPPASPGQIKAWLAAPGLVDRIDLTGSLTPGGRGLQTDITVDGKGITAAGAGSYLKRLGVEPQLKDGTLHVRASASVAMSDSGITASLGLNDVKLSDGADELLGLDRLQVANLRLGNGIDVDSIEIDHPRATVMRDETGAFHAAGMRISIPPPPATIPTTAAAPMPAIAAAPATPAATSPAAPVVLPQIGLKSFDLKQAAISWTDRLPATAVQTTLTADAHVDAIAMGRPADPARYTATIAAAGVIESLTASGTLGLSVDSPTLGATVAGTGIRAGPLAAYLPAGIISELKSGTISATLAAGMAPNPAGGHSAHLTVTAVDWREAGAAAPMLKLDRLQLGASRIDLAGKTIAIDQISDNGLELEAHRTADGAIHAMGIEISGAGPAPSSSAPAAAAPPVAAPAPVANAALPTPLSATPPAPVVVPLITIEKLDVGVDRFTYSDAALGNGTPFVARNLRLASPSRIQLAGSDPDSLPPVRLHATGAIDPMLGGIDLTTSLNPFAQQPILVVDVALSGINGDGITRFIPPGSLPIDGKSLTEGQFKSHVELTARPRRHGPYDFNLSHGAELDLIIKGTEYREKPDGDVLAGLDGVESDGIDIDPARGDVIVKSIEMSTPRARGYRDESGIHVLGLTIQLPAATTQPTTASSPASVASTTQPAAEAPAAAAPATPAVRPTSVIRIDKVLVSGLDVNIEDRTVQPTMYLSLNALDLEVRGLSNQAPFEDKPIIFSALVNSAKVPLPAKKGSALDLDHLENRESFSQITAAGNIWLYPDMHGWAKTSVSGFELLAVHGEAEPFGVHVGGGTYDGAVDLTLKPHGVIVVKSTHVLTDPELTEGDNGPIRKLLQLPSPLNIAIGAIQAADGSITLPVDVSVSNGKPEDIALAAAKLVSSVMLTAIVNAPLKAVGDVGNLLGLGHEKAKAPRVFTITFSPGATALEPGQAIALDAAITALRDDPDATLTIRHVLGGGDVLRAALLANPTPQEAANLAYRLHEEKIQLLAERSELAGQARAQVAILPGGQTTGTLARLAQIDRQIAVNEDSLDSIYDLLRPGADHQAARRTRATALEIGRGRMDAVRGAILAAVAPPPQSNARNAHPAPGAVPDAAARVTIVNPTFAPADSTDGGDVTITVISKKK